MIDFGVDMNYIQDGLIPSKYFEKSIERLVSANGTQMKIKYELNNVHVCHGNACFKIPFVLVKNMTDKVILGLTFINALYPFLVDHNGITTDPFRHEIKFKFASKFEIDIDDTLNLIHAKTKHLNFLRQEVRYKKIVEQLFNKLMQKMLIDDDVPNTFAHSKRHVVIMHYVKWFNTNIFFQGPLMGSFKLLTNIFTGNDHSTKMITITRSEERRVGKEC